MRDSGELPRPNMDGTVLPKTPKPWLETWNFYPYPLAFWGRKRGGKFINNQQCLCDEASITISKVEHLKNSWVGEQTHVPGG